MVVKTSTRLSKEVLTFLRKNKLFKRETYDDVLKRLLKTEFKEGYNIK